MLHKERSLDLFERIPGYPKPAQAPIPQVNTCEIEKRLGLKLNRFTRFIITVVLHCSGFKYFLKTIPERLEELQRSVNLRGPALFAPVVSATLALEDDPRIQTMVDRAVTLLCGAFELYQAVWRAQLPIDSVKGEPCEMGQYPNFFSTCICFENNRPRIYKSTNINQITVIAANRIFILKIDDWKSVSLIHQLKFGLHNILRQAQQSVQQDEFETPAVITATKDIIQYKAFKEMGKDQTNIESLEALKHSFLTLCFDIGKKPETYSEALLQAHSSNFANRWNHSSLQIIIFENLKTCAICNFSAYLDGNTMVRGIAELQKRAAKIQILDSSDSATFMLPAVKELDWKIDRSIVQAAREGINSILDNQKATYSMDGIGTHFFETHGYKAVPAFVIALQLAVKRLTGKIIPITQFVSMSKYCCMDLTTTMVTTPEVKDFILSIDTERVDKNKTLDLFVKAVTSQIIKVQDARNDMPIDDLISYYIHSRKKIKKMYTALIFGSLFKILQKSGALESMRRNIVISHPTIYSQVPLIGRPGVKLPYVTYFGLHYQIFENSITFTFMPGLTWTTTNGQLFSEISKSLLDLASLINEHKNRQTK